MFEIILLFLVSFSITYIFTYYLIPRLKRMGMVGKDVNKIEKNEVAEMGGISIVAGVMASILLLVFINTLATTYQGGPLFSVIKNLIVPFITLNLNLILILAALLTIMFVAMIGVIDDLLSIPQALKAFLPILAAIPLVAVNAAGSTAIAIPFFGIVDFGILYLVILIPIGVAVASNLTNMFAGFNGMESSLAIIIFMTVGFLAYLTSSSEMLAISVSMVGAHLAFLFFNWYPAKVFPGDVGNLTIGAALAVAVIIGNVESAGAILLIPYVVDFFIKAKNQFPSSKWWGENRAGKLYPVEGKIRGFAQFIMAKTNGVSEKNLVLLFIFMELLCVCAVLIFFSVQIRISG